MRYILLLLPLFLTSIARADSPLTSTPFADAYQNEEMVLHVKQNQLDNKAMEFLSNKKANRVVKIAMINELSWGDMAYTQAYQKYLIANGKATEKTFDLLRHPEGSEKKLSKAVKKMSTDELMSWAYLNALGNYFNPQMSETAARLAMKKAPESMACATVYALIQCQVEFDKSWCNIYKTGQKYFANKTYKKDQLNETAIEIILEYLNLYKDDC